VEANRTTYAVQCYLNELADLRGDAPAEPIVRALLERSVDRLHMLCARLLYRAYPRLTRGPLHLQSAEMLSAVVERLIKAMREVRPKTVRQFFALANQHMRWELNDLARRLDDQATVIELRESLVQAPPEVSDQPDSPKLTRILEAIDGLPEEEREVFNLVRLQGLTHKEASEVIGVSGKTIQRRLNRCLLLLSDVLGDLKPSSSEADDEIV
jgi:RNA polymerase sigma-70 factor (ECF subfamily)